MRCGDFDSDGHTDLAVCETGGVRLLRNDGHGKFQDVTEKTGIRREKGCVAATFVDYDHDGDLDLYLTMAPNSETRKNKLWRNNGNSTFTDVSEESGMGLEATGAGVAMTDFNNDRAIDFVVAGGPRGAAIFLNPREGKFKVLPGIDFARICRPLLASSPLISTRTAGWIWRLLTLVRRDSPCGETSRARSSNAFTPRSRLEAGLGPHLARFR